MHLQFPLNEDPRFPNVPGFETAIKLSKFSWSRIPLPGINEPCTQPQGVSIIIKTLLQNCENQSLHRKKTEVLPACAFCRVGEKKGSVCNVHIIHTKNNGRRKLKQVSPSFESFKRGIGRDQLVERLVLTQSLSRNELAWWWKR